MVLPITSLYVIHFQIQCTCTYIGPRVLYIYDNTTELRYLSIIGYLIYHSHYLNM